MPENVEILNQLKKMKGISTGTSQITGTVTVGVTTPLTVLKVGQVSVGTATAKALTSVCTAKCVGLIAHSANVGKIYFGASVAITTANAFELDSPVSLSLDNANKVYVIGGGAAANKVCWAVLV